MFLRACVRGGKMMSCQKITLDDSIIRKLEGKYINFPAQMSHVTAKHRTFMFPPTLFTGVVWPVMVP